MDFRKYFNIVPWLKLSKKLEELMVRPELRVVMTRLYENVISKLEQTRKLIEMLESSKGVTCSLTFWQFTLISLKSV